MFRFYNANVETLAYSNRLGGAGFSGISANFYPYVLARICSGLGGGGGGAGGGGGGGGVGGSGGGDGSGCSVGSVSGGGTANESDVDRLQRLVSVCEEVVCDGYPRSAKAYLAQTYVNQSNDA